MFKSAKEERSVLLMRTSFTAVAWNRLPVMVTLFSDLRMLEHFEGADAVTAGDVMAKNPYTVESGTSLEEVVFAMSRQKIGSAVICSRGDVVGIFTSTDALNALVEILRGQMPE